MTDSQAGVVSRRRNRSGRQPHVWAIPARRPSRADGAVDSAKAHGADARPCTEEGTEDDRGTPSDPVAVDQAVDRPVGQAVAQAVIAPPARR
jgi:hypothetical protein